jgi:hypothetical protein
MSIVGVSGSSSNLYQYLQSLTSAPNTGATAPQTVGATDSDGDSDGSGTAQSTGATTNSQGTSSTNSGAPNLIQQLETAIQGALNGVNSSQSNDPQTVLSSIEQAIKTTLQNNGIDPSQLSQTGHRHHHGHHGGGQGGSAAGVIAALGANGGNSSSSSDMSGSTNPSATSQTPGLDALLAQLNVDPQQFRNDIISALSSTQNGSVDQSQVFQSFPTGQNVNVLR